jgi:hypothetical protein
VNLRGFGLGHRLPGGFYGRAFFGSSSSPRRRRAASSVRVNVHLSAADLIELREQARKDTLMTWKVIGIIFGLSLLFWPILNLDTHPFAAWSLLLVEIGAGILVFLSALEQWRRG